MKSLTCLTSMLPLMPLFPLLLTPLSLSAQETGHGAAPPAAGVRAVLIREQNLMTMKVDVELERGAPLPDAVDQLRAMFEKSFGVKLNIVLGNDAGDISLPELKLNQVTLPQIFEVLRNSSPQVTDPGQGMIVPGFYFQCGDEPPTPESIWYLKRAPGFNTPAVPPVPRFYNLTRILAGGTMTIDDVSTALREAWKLSVGGQDPAVTFHKETGLLVVAGEGVKVDMVDSLIEALNQNALSAEAKRLTEEREAAQREMKMMVLQRELEAQSQSNEKKVMEQSMMKIEAENEKLQEELRRLQQALVETEARLQSAQKAGR